MKRARAACGHIATRSHLNIRTAFFLICFFIVKWDFAMVNMGWSKGGKRGVGIIGWLGWLSWGEGEGGGRGVVRRIGIIKGDEKEMKGRYGEDWEGSRWFRVIVFLLFFLYIQYTIWQKISLLREARTSPLLRHRHRSNKFLILEAEQDVEA